MEEILKQAELTGALTDLAMGVIIIPMIILLLKKKTALKLQKRWWLYFFATLCVSCFLGFTVHYFCKSEISKQIVWLPLFILLYEVFDCFFLVALSIFSDDEKPQKKHIITIHLISLTAYIITQIFIRVYNFDSIRLLTVFNTVIALIGFALILIKSFKKGHIGERVLFCALLPMLPAGYFQIKRNTLVKMIWYFDHNGLTHLLIIASIIILFCAVNVCLDKKNSS